MTELDVRSILLAQYPFEEILELTLLKGGVSNDNYMFSDGRKKYIARVCLFESKNQIDSMIPFLKYAEVINYPAPRLLKSNDGHDYVQSDGIPVVVTTYLEGVSANTISLDAQHLKSLAQLVAGFHKMEYSPPSTPITLDPDYIFRVYNQVSNYIPTDNDKDSLRLIELIDIYYRKFKDEKFTEFAKKLPHGLTHGDINLGNVMFDGDRAISLLDFEELGISWQLQDIAVILITWTYQEGKPNRTYIDTFLKEYELLRPLAKIETENIVRTMEFIAFRQCVYAKRMLFRGSMKSVKDFSSYRALVSLYEDGLSLNN